MATKQLKLALPEYIRTQSPLTVLTLPTTITWSHVPLLSGDIQLNFSWLIPGQEVDGFFISNRAGIGPIGAECECHAERSNLESLLIRYVTWDIIYQSHISTEISIVQT